jgi:hypothetical protein
MLEHGDVVRMVIGPPGLLFETTMVFHPDAVQHVLATAADRFSKESSGRRGGCRSKVAARAPTHI